jgi:voltage-dependent calcium channel R type alpha-1E
MYIYVMHILDQIINYVFTFEMCLKIVSLGFIMDDGSYLRESWNILDFFIVSSSLLEMSL